MVKSAVILASGEKINNEQLILRVIPSDPILRGESGNPLFYDNSTLTKGFLDSGALARNDMEKQKNRLCVPVFRLAF